MYERLYGSLQKKERRLVIIVTLVQSQEREQLLGKGRGRFSLRRMSLLQEVTRTCDANSWSDVRCRDI